MDIDYKIELKNKVESALENIRPFLIADGGNIELIDITDNFIVQVKLIGSCENCKMSITTIKSGVETTVKNAVPEIKSVIAIN